MGQEEGAGSTESRGPALSLRAPALLRIRRRRGWCRMTFDMPLQFNKQDTTERRLRGCVHWLGSMKRPHHAWVGKKDWLAQWSPRLEEKKGSAPLTVTALDGDHFSSFPPALLAFVAEIRGGRIAPDAGGTLPLAPTTGYLPTPASERR